MNSSADFLACLVVVTVFTGVFALLAFWRYLRHREIIALAEKGLLHPQPKDGKDALRWGIVFTAIGLALILGLLPVAWQGAWPLLLLGLLPAFFGLSLVLIYVLTRPGPPQPPASGGDDQEPHS
ncbi:MAG: DUF6249 domain-containing protein [Chloroflexota bacterium]